MTNLRIAVAGATGLVGRATVTALEAAGHDVVSISRSNGIDVTDGAGLADAFDGVFAVIDVTNTAETEERAAEDFFGTVSENLLAAEAAAGVAHHVALSIVGIDRVQGNGHYAGKRRQEAVVAAGTIPFTILRATQFFDFAEMVVSWTTQDGVATIAPLLMQPVAVVDVASTLAELAIAEPVRGIVELAGPDPQDMVDMARRTLAARGQSIGLVPSWDGMFREPMSGKVLLPGPDARIGSTSFDDWLETIAAG